MAKKFDITFQRTAYVDYCVEAEDREDAIRIAYDMFDTLLLNNALNAEGYDTEIADVYELDDDTDVEVGTFHTMCC